MENPMHIDGKCHCGAITYEAEIDPATVSACHCTDCQVFSGSPFRASVPAAKENFKLLSGTPKIYVKTAASGNKRAQAFCPECGTPIYATTPTDPQVYGLRLGAVKQRAQLKPGKQVWCNSALPWAMDMNAISTKVAGQT
jgi:hypothetical protein